MPDNQPSAPSKSSSTRKRLLDAALKLLREEGWASLSTVRLANEAGIVQSGFYRHFPSVEACVSEAIAPISDGVRADIAGRRRALFATPIRDPQEAVQNVVQTLTIALTQPELAAIVVRRRYEHSPVGTLMAGFARGIAADLAEDFGALHAARGNVIPAERVAVVADLILGAAFAAVERLLGNPTPPRFMAETLARMAAAALDPAWLSDGSQDRGALGGHADGNPGTDVAHLASGDRISSDRSSSDRISTV